MNIYLLIGACVVIGIPFVVAMTAYLLERANRKREQRMFRPSVMAALNGDNISTVNPSDGTRADLWREIDEAHNKRKG